MKNSNPLINFIKQLSIKDEKKNNEFKSMKDFFHNSSKKIKSDDLLSYFSPINKFNSTKNEYSVKLKQKNNYLEKISKLNNEKNYKFVSPNKLNEIKRITKCENIKKPESSESSFNNYNNKVGLNAPLSYNELSSNNLSIEKIENPKNNANNDEKHTNYNLTNEIQGIELNNKMNLEKMKNLDYNIFLNIDDKNLKYTNINKKNNTTLNNNSIKLKTNIKKNSITKRVYHPQNNNYSLLSSNRPKSKKEKAMEINLTINKKVNKNEKNNINSSKHFFLNESKKIDFEDKKILNKNKKNIKIKVLSKDSSFKKHNQSIFEKILIDLKSVKSAVNKNNRKIIYINSNSDKRPEIANENNDSNMIENILNLSNNHNQCLVPESNDSKLSSNAVITNELIGINSSRISTNRIKINDTYNLVKKCTDKKNKHFQKNYLKSDSNLMEDYKNNLFIDKRKNKNKRKNNKKMIKEAIYSESNSQDNIFERKEKEEKTEIIKNKIKDNEKNFNTKNQRTINNDIYLKKIFESRKIFSKNKEPIQDNPGVNIYNRSQIFKAKTDIKTEKLRKKLQAKEKSELTNIPKINKKSKILSKNNLPIYERLNDIEKKKQSDIQRIKDIIIKENDIDENVINHGKNFDKKKFDKWLKLNNDWNQNKKNKMEQIKNMLNKEELNNENFTFIPKIDNKSEKIFNQNKKLSKSPVVDRLFKKNNNKELILEKEQSKKIRKFLPEINKEYKISKSYYNFMEEDQAELYNELREKIKKEEKKH